MHTHIRSLETFACASLILAVVSIVPLRAQVPQQPPAPADSPVFQQQPAQPRSALENLEEEGRQSLGSWEIDLHAFVALPLATALGAALALRPRRRGTPKR